MKIAVLMNGMETTASFSEEAVLLVYQREGDTWTANWKYDWTPGVHRSMATLRTCLSEIVDWLEDCKVVVANQSNGFYRVTFESLGVALWEMKGRPSDLIPQIECFYDNEDREKVESPVELIGPVVGRAGHYTVDLRQVMAHDTAFNSRDVLLPFFKETAFERLEIICDHVPKWFDAELPLLGLRADAEACGRATKVHVYPV